MIPGLEDTFLHHYFLNRISLSSVCKPLRRSFCMPLQFGNDIVAPLFFHPARTLHVLLTRTHPSSQLAATVVVVVVVVIIIVVVVVVVVVRRRSSSLSSSSSSLWICLNHLVPVKTFVLSTSIYSKTQCELLVQ